MHNMAHKGIYIIIYIYIKEIIGVHSNEKKKLGILFKFLFFLNDIVIFMYMYLNSLQGKQRKVVR